MSESGPQAPQQVPKKKQRLLSLDALRGFDMFWILGGEKLFAALLILTGWQGWKLAEAQVQHSQWHGFTLYDLIFPLFIFLSGVTLGLSPTRINHQPLSQRWPRYRKAVNRLILLLVLGVFYNHGWGVGMPADPEQIRYTSVLGRIGIAWFVAAMLVWHTSLRFQMIAAVSLLLGYWLLLMAVPVPGVGAGHLTPAGSWNAWVDQHLLPGITYQNRPTDPEGLLSNVTSVVNALMGVFAGHWLASASQRGPWRTTAQLFGAGLLSLALGWSWDLVFPVNKDLWTSSFVLVTVGWSAILLAAFYLLVDVLGWRKLAMPFAVIGVNSIGIYIASSLFDWGHLTSSLVGGLIQGAPLPWQELLSVMALLLMQWWVLYWMFRRKIFINV